MEMTKPVYKWVNDGLAINYDTSASRGMALNFSGPTWPDVKLGLVKNLLKQHTVIVTDSDLLAHDDYIVGLEGAIVVLYVGTHSAAPSKKRLRMAYDKLKSAGIYVRYFASSETMERFVAKLKGGDK